MKYPTLIAALSVAFCNMALADSLKNPDGFNTPTDHVIATSSVEEFGLYTKGDPFECLPKKAICASLEQVFKANGYPAIEGKIEETTYKRSDGKNIAGFLMQKNYERVIKEMGGRPYAEMNGEDVSRGYMHHIHLIEKGGQKKWVVVDTRASSNALKLVVITQIKTPEVLEVGEFQNQLETQGYITLNVNFDTNKSAIRGEDKPTLNQIVQLLKASPSLRVSVDGHTDNVGSAAANKALSRERSEAIVAYLVAEGAEKSRLLAKGFGAENPIADNRNEEGRKKNRRVELVKLK